MDILTGERMRRVDEDTIARHLPGIELMERAGRHIADFICDRYPEVPFKASIFVGPGNNGGDALVVARLLAEAGRSCTLHYLAPPDKLTMDAYKNYQRLQERMDNPLLREVTARTDWANVLRHEFIESTLIVDGLFGTGLTRDLEGRAAEFVHVINDSHLPVVSIDVPSGIHSDTGAVLGEAVRATHTVTMGFPKIGMLFHPGKPFVGELEVADLGFPDEVLQVHSMGAYLLDARTAANRLPHRTGEQHKYDAGTAVVVAGSRAYTGAALLAGEAALRAGCGMVYLAVPESIRPIMQTGLREAVVVGLPETSSGTIAPAAVEALAPYVAKAKALAIGPGLTTNTETAEFVARMVQDVPLPAVIDADAINVLAGKTDIFKDSAGPRVLTPHSGELARLTDRTIPGSPVERLEFTREIAEGLGVMLLHKGAPSILASRGGDVWVSLEGGPELATAGTGDVLTGLVVGLLAQGATVVDATAVATFVHGRAGGHAATDLGFRSVIAGDVLAYAPAAFSDLE